MITIEHRRHSIRSGNGHLTQQGVELAHHVAKTSLLPKYDYVVTSPLARAPQTAVAFGFGINEVREEIKEFNEFYRPLPPWDGGFLAMHNYFMEHAGARDYLKKFTLSVITSQPQAKSFLFVSHSGIVESFLLSCLQDDKIKTWGRELTYCEGVRFQWDGSQFLNPEILRIDGF